MPDIRSRDLAVPPGRYIHILDRTKGHVQTVTGPNKVSMSETEVAVVFDPAGNRYDECGNPIDALRQNVIASLGEYVVLTNPASEKADTKHPEDGKVATPPRLEVGNILNIPGPVSFALWWQQGATVIPGHSLRSNQFLVVEITDDRQARENWKKAVYKPQVLQDPSGDPKAEAPRTPPGAIQATGTISTISPETFTMGQRIIIRGTEVSFFIPPTGMRVVPDEKSPKHFVREAVTLESLQYCVLLDENGKKTFTQGPAVVFPKPTEIFVEEGGSRVFKAIELNSISGIHVMVIADYKEGEKEFKAGQELFISGKNTAIYYPRPEHAIIKYDGKNVVHYATAVPAGEGRYVMNRETGEVKLVTGPNMLLLDPTKEVFVRRILPDNQTRLWFPGNNRAIEVNQELTRALEGSGSKSVTPETSYGRSSALRSLMGREDTSVGAAADSIERRTAFTPPRTITLETKYQGAVAIGIWPGYAVQIVRKDGRRRVEIGPKTVLLEYDESLTQLSLSTGKPKTTERLQETVYLKLTGNQVSDVVTVETSDGIEVQVRLGLQVEFGGDDRNKWFDVDNYVKLITDHVRSLLRGVAKHVSVAEFTNNNIAIIRDTVLGKKVEEEARPGQVFSQNGARIYDVEILGASVTDRTVAELIKRAQQTIVQGNLNLTAKKQELEITTQTEEIARKMLGERSKTAKIEHDMAMSDLGHSLERQLAEQKIDDDSRLARIEADLAIEAIADKIAAAELVRKKAAADQQQAIDARIQKLNLERLEAESAAVKARVEAIKPDFVAAIQASNDRDALVKVAEQLGIAAYLRNQSVGAMVQELLAGGPLAGTFGKLLAATGKKTEPEQA